MLVRKVVYSSLLVFLAVAYFLVREDRDLPGQWLYRMLGRYPAASVDLDALSSEDAPIAILERFPDLKLSCHEQRTQLGDLVCWADIVRFNGFPASNVAFFFRKNALRHLRVATPGWHHRSVVQYLQGSYGHPQATGALGIHRERVQNWTMRSGVIAASEKLAFYQESVILWTSNREVFEQVETMAARERKTEKLPAPRPRKASQKQVVDYRSDTLFLGSYDAARAIPRLLDTEFFGWAQKNLERLPSPIIIELAHRTFDYNKREAMKWFAAFQILASYDARRCRDQTAAQGMIAMIARYPELISYARKEQDIYLQAWAGARQVLGSRGPDSSPMWLCAHGIQAFRFDAVGSPESVSVTELVHAEKEWPALWDRTLRDQKEVRDIIRISAN